MELTSLTGEVSSITVSSMDIEKVYIVRSSDPQDHEGARGVVATLEHESDAKEVVRVLSDEAEAGARALRGDRWRDIAMEFDYDEVPMAQSAEEAIEQYRFRGYL